MVILNGIPKVCDHDFREEFVIFCNIILMCPMRYRVLRPFKPAVPTIETLDGAEKDFIRDSINGFLETD